MEDVKIKGTDRLPEIDFNYGSNRFSIGGYSFPENVTEFYDPIIKPLTDHLDSLDGTTAVEVIFDFKYFHSSTAQVLYGLFDTLEACAQKGSSISVDWCYEKDDDNMAEAGEDFAEEASSITFSLKEVE